MLVNIAVVISRHIRDKVHRRRSMGNGSSKRFGYKRTHHKQHSQSRQMILAEHVFKVLLTSPMISSIRCFALFLGLGVDSVQNYNFR